MFVNVYPDNSKIKTYRDFLVFFIAHGLLKSDSGRNEQIDKFRSEYGFRVATL